MKKQIKDMDMKELGGFICDALIAKDIHVVLSGGSCVEIYSRGEYTSWDLDLVSTLWNNSWPVVGVSFLYLFFFEAFNNGQTLGKMVMKIQTVDENTFGTITHKQAALHTIGKLFLPIDVIIGLIQRDKSESEMEKNQVRFSQKFSHTSVISLK